MSDLQQSNMRVEARQDFEKARRRARRSEVSARLTGRANRLIPFEEIRSELRQQNPLYRGVQQIKIDDIIGSVGRYRDFNREFLPLTDTMRERWVTVQSLTVAQGWPPIELYKVGDAYFVRDGNHRTAIARQMGNTRIEAHVWEFPADISLSNVSSLDEALIALGASEFELQTNIASWAPDHNIVFTAPGRYGELLVQIEDLRAKLERIDGESTTFEQAAPLWYELVYLPTIQIIDASELNEAFAGRTIADIFVWMSIHRKELGELYGDYANLSDLASILVERYRPGAISTVTRQMRNIIGGDLRPHLTEVAEVREELEEQETDADGSAETDPSI